ncbi:hypothetical protein BSNK01_13140 [Bacillaceae bacterium]
MKFLDSYRIALFGMLSGISAAMQLLAAFLPVFGGVIGAFTSLPIAAATKIHPAGGFVTMGISTLAIFSLLPGEALIFLFTVAPLGLVIGWGIARNLPPWLTVTAAGGAFFHGIVVLTYAFGVPFFGNWFQEHAISSALFALAAFSFFYGWLWYRFIKLILRRIFSILKIR